MTQNELKAARGTFASLKPQVVVQNNFLEYFKSLDFITYKAPHNPKCLGVFSSLLWDM